MFCLHSRPRVAIIGSREQLCIHPEVAKKETNSEKVCVRMKRVCVRVQRVSATMYLTTTERVCYNVL